MTFQADGEGRGAAALDVAAYDPFAPAVIADPYPWYARLRAEAPVHQVAGRGYWVLSRYEDVRDAFRDHASFSSARGNAPEPGFQPGLIATDPPAHTRLRRIVQGVFTRRALEETWAARIAEVCAQLVGEAATGEPIDAFERLTLPLPITVIARLLDIPDGDVGEFKRLSDDMVAGVSQHLDPAIQARLVAAFAALSEYFLAKVRDRRRGTGTDLVTRIAQAGDGEALTDREAVHFCILLLVAGNETTTNLLGNALVALARHPAHEAKLRAAPDLLPGAVEEMLRHGPPSLFFCREATRDVDRYHGRTIPKGARVMLAIASANRDERVFPDGERFRVDRVPAADHLSFGSGIHFCLGAMLARLEARLLFTALLARTRRLALAGEPRYVANPVVRGPDRLPMRFEPT